MNVTFQQVRNNNPTGVLLKPQNILAELSGDDIQINWDALPSGYNITLYELWRQDNDEEWVLDREILYGDFAGFAVHLDPPAGNTYRYKVRGKDVNGEYTAYSSTSSVAMPVPVETHPPTPTGFTAVSDPNEIKVILTWDASLGATGYNIDRRESGGTWANLVQNTGGVTTWVDTNGLVTATTYQYRIAASNSYGVSPDSSTVTATTI